MSKNRSTAGVETEGSIRKTRIITYYSSCKIKIIPNARTQIFTLQPEVRANYSLRLDAFE